ncbi:MAG: PspA/IM30 family protein [Lachnospiraceae bacterium]|nr:PspA/IM30 family protein [Lachnospiraceae bacterium]
MGVIQRFKDIMAANFNAMLDKVEDPAKMIDQYLRNLEEDLGNVKAETASVMAEEKRAKRELDEAKEEADKYQRYAQKAVAAGNDNDARTFLQQKKIVSEKIAGLQVAYDAAAANALKMRQMHDKLSNDIATLHARKDAIKAKVAVAKTQEKLNKIGSSLEGVAENLSAFDKMEEKANRMLDKANAMAELNAMNSESTIEDLTLKYDMASEAHSDVDDELAALKAQMGM